MRTSPSPDVCMRVKNDCFSLRQERNLTVSLKRDFEKNI